jgi:type IV secretion system protein VirB5
MPHEHKSTSYKPVDLPNPFHEGQDRAYGDILQDKFKEMRWWRGIVGTGILALFGISLILFNYALSLQKTVPVLVNVMPSGEAVYMGEVRETAALQIPEAAVIFQVRKFIANIRSVSIDSQVLYNNIEECYAMVTGSYEPVMTRMLRAASPFELVGKIRRTVEIESALRITGSSYQVDWIESTIEPGGSPRNKKMRGLVTIKLIPPDPAFIKKNPLGIFIENCEWTEL